MRRVRAVSLTAVVLALVATGQSWAQTTPEEPRTTAGERQTPADAEPALLRQATFSTNPSRTFEFPTLVVDPSDPQTMVLGAVEFTSAHCVTRISTNGGRTWKDGASPQAMGYSNCGITNHNVFPTQWAISMTYDDDGTLYYAFSAAKEADDLARSILLGRSTDNGRSWKTTVVHRGEPAADPQEAEVHVRPSVAVDPQSNEVFVGWRQVPPKSAKNPTHMWIASSEDGGVTFGPPSKLGPGDAPAVVVNERAAFDFFPAEPRHHAGPGEPGPAAADEKPLELVMARSTDGGDSWEKQAIFAFESLSPPTAAVQRSDGTVYVAWSDNHLAEQGEVRKQVFISRSTDDGETWSEPLAVAPNEPEGPRENVNQLYPNVSLAPDGRVDVIWYDYRNDPFPIPKDADAGYLGQLNDVFIASSSDDGRSFGPARRVTRTPIDRRIGTWNSQYFLIAQPGIVSTNAGYAAAWSDTENGLPDIQAPQDIFAAASAGFVASPGDDGGGAFAFGWRDWLLAAELFAVGLGLALLAAWAVVRRRRRGVAA